MRPVYVAVVSAIIAFILAPTLIVIVLSVGEASFVQFPPRGLSLKWYAAAIGRPEFRAAAWTSLWLAASATALATPIALAAAIPLVRGQFRGRDAIQTFLSLPLIMPGVVVGLSLLVISPAIKFRNGEVRLLAAHVLITMPYLLRALMASLARADPTIEEAALTLGASRFRTFVFVTLPGLWDGLLAGLLFAFVISFDNVAVSLFLAGAKSNTLPLAILSYVEFNFDPSIAAVSTLLILLSILTAVVLERAVGLRNALGR